MIATVELSETEIREAVSDYVFQKTGLRLSKEELIIEVKSSKNSKSEWEEATFRGRFNPTTAYAKGDAW